MDIFTHALSGAVAAFVYTPRRTSTSTQECVSKNLAVESINQSDEFRINETRKGVRWALFIGSLLPDIDIVFLLGGWSLYRIYHRGPTHSLIGVFILALFLTLLLGRKYSLAGKKKIFFASLLGMAMHLALDLITSYRTYLLWPFSDYRFALGIVRFRDRTGWAVLGSALGLAWGVSKFLKQEHRTPIISGMGLILYAGYIFLQAGVR
ncbi:MAG: metal-dependent hydrolase [Spirochaetales bacterium]